MKQRGGRHDRDLALVEAEQVGVGDEISGVHVVIGVRDEGAHVVGEGGVVEQLALLRAEVVVAGGARALEELERETGHVAGMGLVGAAGAHEAQDAALAHRELVDQGGVGAARQVVHEQPVAQAALGEGRHGRQLEVAEQRLEHHGAGDHDVGAVGVEARHAAALLERQAAQQLDHLVHVAQARRLVAPGFAIVQHAGGDGRHVAHRPRGAVGDVDVETTHGRHGMHRSQTHGTLQALVVVGRDPTRDVGQAGIAGQAHGAQRQAVEEQVAPAVADDHLGAAAPDVEAEGSALAELDAAPDAEVDEARLLAARHDVHVESGFAAQARHEGALVAGLACGRGGHGDDLARTVAAGERRKGAADGHAALDRRRPQQMVAELLLAQAHGLALQADHPVVLPRRDLHDHETHRVGADVDEADDAAVAVLAPLAAAAAAAGVSAFVAGSRRAASAL